MIARLFPAWVKWILISVAVVGVVGVVFAVGGDLTGRGGGIGAAVVGIIGLLLFSKSKPKRDIGPDEDKSLAEIR